MRKLFRHTSVMLDECIEGSNREPGRASRHSREQRQPAGSKVS